MKKRRFLLVTLLMTACISVFLLSGCSKEKEQNNAENVEKLHKAEEKEEKSETETGTFDDQTGDTDTQVDVEGDIQTRTVALYYVDGETAESATKSIEIQNEQDIWNALKTEGVLTDECELLSLTVNSSDNTLELDFNSATGNRIRSMGTTGETEIIGCIVNTYLEAYNCTGIKLTENGQVLETSSGANLDGYIEKITF